MKGEREREKERERERESKEGVCMFRQEVLDSIQVESGVLNKVRMRAKILKDLKQAQHDLLVPTL